jgi:RNA polymerase sigma-70 factor, ECF subfamily
MNTTTLSPTVSAVEDNQDALREMIRGIANGDRRAFRDFHARFANMVFATAVQVLHNQEDAEDCAQEVFSSLWQKAGMFADEKGKPSTWLATMARNRALDKLRARQRRSKLND